MRRKLFYTIKKLKGYGIVGNRQLSVNYIAVEKNIVEKLTSITLNEKVIQVEKTAERIREEFEKWRKSSDTPDTSLIVMDLGLAYGLQDTSGIKLLNLARFGKRNGKGIEIKERPFDIPNIPSVKIDEVAGGGFIVDIGAYSGETLTEVLKNINGSAYLYLEYSTEEAIKKLKTAGVPFTVSTVIPNEMDDWIEAGDFVFWGRYVEGRDFTMIVPYMFEREGAGLSWVEGLQLILSTPKLREAFSRETGIATFPYSIRSPNTTLSPLFIDFDITLLGSKSLLERLLKIIYKEYGKLGVESSMDAVNKGLFEDRESFFNTIWGKVLQREESLLKRYLCSNINTTKEALELLNELKEKFTVIGITAAPAIYVNKVSELLQEMDIPFIDTFDVVMSAEFFQKKEEGVEKLLKAIYYLNPPSKIIFLDDDPDAVSGVSNLKLGNNPITYLVKDVRDTVDQLKNLRR